jgi:ABC-type glycerol-3-phosphate transport system substrate-binding protein
VSPSLNKGFSFGRKKGLQLALIIGVIITTATSISIIDFSNETFLNVDSAVEGEEVVYGVYKFDFPFLADKLVWEKTINKFKKMHPDLKINYIYTGPSELNSKKKTHLLLYVFTDK